MRILQVVHRYPPQTGGVETHVEEVSERLVDRGHEVRVLSADAGGGGQRRENRGGVKVRRFRAAAPSESYYFAPGIGRAVRRTEADVIHAHNYHAFPASFAILSRRNTRTVFTTHYHGRSQSGIRNRLLSMYRPVGRWLLGQADAVIAVSEWERTQLHKAFGVVPIVVPNGLDVDRFVNAEPVERERRYLLCVGRLEAYKGVQHAIRALPELEGYDLVVAGEGSYASELKRLARDLNVAARVSFPGHVPDRQLPGLYAGATVHVALSEFEAYGMTVAEALAAGTPCVVRNAAALKDWTSNAGVVAVEDHEPQAVAAAVKKAADSVPDSSDLRSWSSVVQQLEDVYMPD